MKYFVLSLLLLAFLLTVGGAKRVSYKWYKTYEVRPKSSWQREALLELETMDGVDFWARAGKKQPAVVMVAPRVHQNFLKVLRKLGIPHDVVISDVEESVHKEHRRQRQSRNSHRRRLTEDYLSRFLTYNEIVRFIKNAAEVSKLAQVESIGKSFEGRSVFMVKLSSDFGAEKPVVMLEAAMHAREWAAPALTLHIIRQLIANPKLLEYNDYHIIPVANPDGYEYTHTTDRFWRKTRSRRPNDACIGADGNRNFNTHWAVVGSSNDSCTDTYHGEKPFSEVEARNVRDAGSKYKQRMVVYVSIHSFGNFLLYPMGHTTKPLPDAPQMAYCAERAAQAIIKENGPEFTTGNTATVLYPSGGGADDYMKEKLHVPFAYTMELPGGGATGFDLPPEEIPSMVQSILPGILSLADCWRNEE